MLLEDDVTQSMDGGTCGGTKILINNKSIKINTLDIKKRRLQAGFLTPAKNQPRKKTKTFPTRLSLA